MSINRAIRKKKKIARENVFEDCSTVILGRYRQLFNFTPNRFQAAFLLLLVCVFFCEMDQRRITFKLETLSWKEIGLSPMSFGVVDTLRVRTSAILPGLWLGNQLGPWADLGSYLDVLDRRGSSFVWTRTGALYNRPLRLARRFIKFLQRENRSRFNKKDFDTQ